MSVSPLLSSLDCHSGHHQRFLSLTKLGYGLCGNSSQTLNEENGRLLAIMISLWKEKNRCRPRGGEKTITARRLTLDKLDCDMESWCSAT